MGPTRSSACSLVVAAIWGAFWVQILGASPLAAQDASYDALIRQALVEYEATRYEEARALFRRAHQVSPNPRTLRGIGMSSYELRDYPAAFRALRDALAMTGGDRALTPAHRVHVEQLLGRVS